MRTGLYKISAESAPSPSKALRSRGPLLPAIESSSWAHPQTIPSVGEPPDDVTSLTFRLAAHLPNPARIDLSFTDNRHTMVSVKRERSSAPPRYHVRVHHMFCEAPSSIIRALAFYIVKNDSMSSRQLGKYIDSQQHLVKPRTRSFARMLETEGAYFDLQQIFDQLNAKYFAGTIEANITWGHRLRRVRRRNSIKMGSYCVEERLIRMHRSLDRTFVPKFFVEWVVYHEMLHQKHGCQIIGGKRHFHTKEFLADEALFEHYELARRWEKAHINQLLTF